MALPRNQDKEEEKQNDPCDVGCGRPWLYGDFWSKRLCEPCWFAWKDAFDADFDARGGKATPEPGILFEQWFAGSRLKRGAA